MRNAYPRNWCTIPFCPRNWPFFYGWVIVAAAIVGMLASIPGQTMGVGVFTDALIKTLHLSRTQLSTAYMLGTIGSALMLPYAGAMLDRWGVRTMIVIASLGLGLATTALANVDRILGDPAAASVLTTIAVTFVCFMFMRFFGQGCLAMVSRVAIGKWFEHRRGLATAVATLFMAFGFNSSPYALNAMVGAFGWRGSCLILAAIVGLGMTVIGWVFMRDNPEECGLVMDGVTDPAWHARMARRVPDTQRQFTRGQAVRTLAFWAFNLGTATQALIITGVTFHATDLGAEMGMSRVESYSVFLPMGFFSVPTNFIAGWLSDRVKLKWLLLVMMCFQAVGASGLLSYGEPIGWWLMTAGFGVSGGLFGLLMTVTWPRFFGREHLGAVSGVNMSIVVFASALAPLLFSELHDWTGNYRGVVLLCWCLPIAVILMSLRANNPQESVPRQSASAESA